MAYLAFKGNKEKSDLIMNTLRGVYGKNVFDIHPIDETKLYGFGSDFIIIEFDDTYKNSTKVVYDIDEFLKKFPYKVHDKVVFADEEYDGTYIITTMNWDFYYGGIHCSLESLDRMHNDIIGLNMKLIVVTDNPEDAKKNKDTIAIKGDKEKGKYIINYLESLGGINKYKCDGCNELAYYFINRYDNCIIIHEGNMHDPYKMFTINDLIK